jgi:hypothetical protein
VTLVGCQLSQFVPLGNRRAEGSVVEVELDENFKVTGTEKDDDSDEVEGTDDD